MYNEQAFTHWMQHQNRLSEPTCRSRLSNCRRIEDYEGDLDTHYAADRCAGVLTRLNYTRDDANAGRNVLHRIPINGDQYNGTATLCSALRLYMEFCDSQRTRSGPSSSASAAPAASTASAAVILPATHSRTSRTTGTADWPAWETPTADAILTLARMTTPYVRFLHPGIVAAIVEDTEHHRATWSAALQQRGISPDTYLWERGACGFPGIRRYAGSSEIAIHRKRMSNDTTPLIGALKTDDNTFPKHLWSFMLRGRPFQQFGPDDYALAHLLDHKDDKPGLDRLNLEIAHPDQLQLNTPLYGLFTSAANTVYLPRALIRPTDFNHSLRTLIQRRAQQLYGAVCNLVPHPWTIRESADSAWSPEAFTWAEPVGSLQYLKQFLAFRHERLARLFSQYTGTG
jgi:hypothetical protein